MPVVDYTTLSRTQKIAAFLIMVGVDAASELMKQLDPGQLEAICKEMTTMPVIDEPIQEKLVEEFSEIVLGGTRTLLGGAGFAQAALEKARGDYEAFDILNRIAPNRITTTNRAAEGGEEIRQMDAMQIVNLVKNELPQTIAFILACLDTPKAAEVVTMLAPELREEVVQRIAGMEETPRGVVNKIAKNLRRHIDRRTLQQEMQHNGGVKSVAAILNSMEKELRKAVLTHIEDRDADIGAMIRRAVFTFEDALNLETMDLQRVLREVDMSDLVIAMKNAKPGLLAAVMGAMSRRAAEGLKEEIEMLPPQKTKAIEAAQEKIILVVRKLDEAEEITLDRGERNAAA